MTKLVKVSDRFMGVGVQWDRSDIWDFSPEQWEMNIKRLGFFKPQFIRCMYECTDYCVSFDEQGGTYDWNSPEMKRLYIILDYCEKNGIDVIIGEWNRPLGPRLKEIDVKTSCDPNWSVIVADCITYLLATKNYTCIKYYNNINEPNGFWAITDYGVDVYPDTYVVWKQSMINLHRELKRRGIREKIKIVGPDCTWKYDFVKKTAEDIPHIIDVYDVHKYEDDENLIYKKHYELIASLRAEINEFDPDGKNKLFYCGEAGMKTGLGDFDQQRRTFQYEYGVYMTAYIVQALSANQNGVILWMLDDAMHQYNTLTKDDKVLHEDIQKIWGFWNTVGTKEEQKIRPWFYPMSVLSRTFLKDSEIFALDQDDGLHVILSKKDSIVSLAAVNLSDDIKEFSIPLDAPCRMSEYSYYKNSYKTDENGFPLPDRISDMTDVLSFTLDGFGVKIFTNLII